MLKVGHRGTRPRLDVGAAYQLGNRAGELCTAALDISGETLLVGWHWVGWHWVGWHWVGWH